MKFLDWFKPKAKTARAKISAQIVVSNKPPRTDLPEFCVDAVDGIVNLWPFAAEVLDDYPEKLGIDVDALARLATMGYNGKYIKVGEYPKGVDREVVKELIGRVHRWSDWPRRFSRLQASGNGVFSSRKFKCGDGACTAARAMEGQIVGVEAVERLPLNGCWGNFCRCEYRLVK